MLCISAEPQTSQEPREEVEIDLCGIFATTDSPVPTDGDDAKVTTGQCTVAAVHKYNE